MVKVWLGWVSYKSQGKIQRTEHYRFVNTGLLQVTLAFWVQAERSLLSVTVEENFNKDPQFKMDLNGYFKIRISHGFLPFISWQPYGKYPCLINTHCESRCNEPNLMVILIFSWKLCYEGICKIQDGWLVHQLLNDIALVGKVVSCQQNEMIMLNWKGVVKMLIMTFTWRDWRKLIYE